MRFCKFTRPDGRPTWVAPAWVIAVDEPSASDPVEAETVIHISGGQRAVLEEPKDVLGDLEAARD